MSQLALKYAILCIAFIGNGLGCLFIVKKHVFRYGIVLIISLVLASCLCLIFYWMDFYRFVLPLPLVLPVVAISFSFLALFMIKYRPKRRTFPFFFTTLTLVFSMEVLLKDFAGFIKFRNGWDYWDSYSLYWVYIRVFDRIGEYLVPLPYRSPVRSDTKKYWVIFLLVVFYTYIGITILYRGWTHIF
jgi:hypothetical protein